jgi:hypothetical protein
VQLPQGEPPFGPWRVVPAGAVPDMLGRPRVVAVDGRSGSGKSTACARIAAAVPGTAVVHSDDVAWYHHFFDWAELMAGGVLEPLRRGAAVAFRPPEWDARGRAGAIRVPADAPLVLVEGVGVGRRELAALVDAVVWVQADRPTATRRGILRDGGDVAFWEEWERCESPFLAAQRPWERAGLVVAGAPEVAHDPATQLVVADGPPAGVGRAAPGNGGA